MLNKICIIQNYFIDIPIDYIGLVIIGNDLVDWRQNLNGVYKKISSQKMSPTEVYKPC